MQHVRHEVNQNRLMRGSTARIFEGLALLHRGRRQAAATVGALQRRVDVPIPAGPTSRAVESP